MVGSGLPGREGGQEGKNLGKARRTKSGRVVRDEVCTVYSCQFYREYLGRDGFINHRAKFGLLLEKIGPRCPKKRAQKHRRRRGGWDAIVDFRPNEGFQDIVINLTPS